MSKIWNWSDFISESFFKKIKKGRLGQKNDIEELVEEILNFLNENGIWNWTDFITSKKTDKYIINKMIDSSLSNLNELKEFRWKLRLELSNRNELLEFLKEMERDEDYEKCALILKKLNTK